MPPSKLSFKEQMRDFPVWQIAVTSMVRFAEPIAFTSLFPYVYFMVRDFHVAENEAEIAKYVGYLSSSFAFCQFLSSVHWGHMADVIGRKRVLISGLLLTSCAILLFGFSQSFLMALLARSMMGLFNGNIAVIRTALGEIAVHKRHQAIAFSTLPLLWQVGCIIGPFLGGVLTNVDVSKEYSVQESLSYKSIAPIMRRSPVLNSQFETFIERYPYALSNIVVSCGLVSCATICFLFFEETHYQIKFEKDRGLTMGDKIIRAFGYTPPIRPWEKNYRYKNRENSIRTSSISAPVEEFRAAERQPLLQDQPRDDAVYDGEDLASLDSSASEASAASVHSIGILSRRQSLALMHTYSIKSNLINEEAERNQTNGYEWGVLLAPQVFFAIFSNFALSLTNIVVEEFLPVFLASKTKRELEGDMTSPLISKFPFKIVGGMNFDPTEVGNLLSISGAIGVILVIFVYPLIDRTFPPVKAFRTFISLTPFVYFSIPFLIFALPPNTPSIAYTKAALYVVAFFKVLSNSICFPQIMLLIHRASPAKNRSFINGTTISVTAFARCVGPFWGYIMTWSDEHELGGLTWWSLSAVAVLSVIPSFLLKENVDDNSEETTIIDDTEV